MVKKDNKTQETEQILLQSVLRPQFEITSRSTANKTFNKGADPSETCLTINETSILTREQTLSPSLEVVCEKAL